MDKHKNIVQLQGRSEEVAPDDPSEESPEPPINRLHYFEVGDRCHIVNVHIDEALMDHPAITPEMRKHLEDAQSLICEVYQWAFRMYEDIKDEDQ